MMIVPFSATWPVQPLFLLFLNSGRICWYPSCYSTLITKINTVLLFMVENRSSVLPVFVPVLSDTPYVEIQHISFSSFCLSQGNHTTRHTEYTVTHQTWSSTFENNLGQTFIFNLYLFCGTSVRNLLLSHPDIVSQLNALDMPSTPASVNTPLYWTGLVWEAAWNDLRAVCGSCKMVDSSRRAKAGESDGIARRDMKASKKDSVTKTVVFDEVGWTISCQSLQLTDKELDRSKIMRATFLPSDLPGVSNRLWIFTL